MFSNFHRTLLCLCLFVACFPAAGQRRSTNRKVVLAWADTRNGVGQHDSVSHALAVIERLGYESGAYDTFIRTDSNIISKHPLMTDGKPWEKRSTEELRAEILQHKQQLAEQSTQSSN